MLKWRKCSYKFRKIENFNRFKHFIDFSFILLSFWIFSPFFFFISFFSMDFHLFLFFHRFSIFFWYSYFFLLASAHHLIYLSFCCIYVSFCCLLSVSTHFHSLSLSTYFDFLNAEFFPPISYILLKMLCIFTKKMPCEHIFLVFLAFWAETVYFISDYCRNESPSSKRKKKFFALSIENR